MPVTPEQGQSIRTAGWCCGRSFTFLLRSPHTIGFILICSATELSQLFCMLGELPSCWRGAEERRERAGGTEAGESGAGGRGTGNGEGAPRGDEMGCVGRRDLPEASVGL